MMPNNISDDSQLETCWLIRSFGYYLTAIWILGTLLNGSILFLFLRHKKLRQTSTNIFIGGLLLADFFGALIPTPLTAISMLHCRWIFGDFGCTFQSITAFFTGCSNMYMLCVISMDRYLVVTKSFSQTVIDPKQALFIIMGVYGAAFFWTMMPVIGWSKYDYEGLGVSCSIKWEDRSFNVVSFTTAVLLCVFLIPVTIILTTNIKVYRLIHSRGSRAQLNRNEYHAHRQYVIERRIVHTVIFIIIGFIVAWTPYASTVIIRTYISPKNFPRLIGTTLGIFAKTSIVWNPIIYAMRNQNFNQYFRSCSNIREEQRITSDPIQNAGCALVSITSPLTRST